MSVRKFLIRRGRRGVFDQHPPRYVGELALCLDMPLLAIGGLDMKWHFVELPGEVEASLRVLYPQMDWEL